MFSRPHLFFSDGALATLDRLPLAARARNVLLVANESTLGKARALPSLLPFLSTRRYVHVNGFRPNPEVRFLLESWQNIRSSPVDIIMAVGGGTAIDTAKILRGCLQWKVGPDRLASCTASSPERRVPLIAAPTTAGSGSEATHFAVMYCDGHKLSIAHESLIPDVALVDPTLTRSMSRQQAVASGLDALCQAVESLWALNATSESVSLADISCRVCLGALEESVVNPCSDSRTAMCLAAHFAGLAINISRTTACHALSYYLTHSFQVPHGLAVAVFLPFILQYNAAALQKGEPGPASPVSGSVTMCRVLNALGVVHLADGLAKIDALLGRLGAPRRLREWGVRYSDLPEMARSVNVQRLNNNPVPMSLDDIMAVLGRAW